MPQSFGKITVEGTPAQLALAARAYAGQKHSPPVGDLLPHEFPIKFHTAQEMYDLGAIIPNSRKTKQYPKGQPAYGFTFPKVLCINSDAPTRDQVYALRHEPFHPIVAAHMTANKRDALLKLVERVADGTAYQNRLNEVLCDAFVELFWGGSILDRYYGDIADDDLQKAWDILMKPVQNEPVIPVEPPTPLPVPDPRDQQIADLQAQVVALGSQVTSLNAQIATGWAHLDSLTAQLAAAEGKMAAARAALS